MNSRRNFYLLGILFLVLLGIIAFVRTVTNSLSFLEILMYATAAYICFARGYIYPQFKQKDERANFIKQKGMKWSFIALLIYLVLILYGTYFDVISLTIFEMASTLIALTLITLFSSWVILSKKY
ncbi:hypothetical protein MOB34_05855 [Bacillus spizizenii]|nr:hypothetical protein [Bacillus spizizenii]MCY7933859.1 hypothetical protein [Bacillus spizizenii]MCY8229254.1 hypothetical protein [Bacillus spizizenii]MCY8888172.1 hypothetical protein [Bacillus spizizenii]MCY9427057.1 hypothetical protein [Bacillus spizizenii]